jgi:hypothetical protein
VKLSRTLMVALAVAALIAPSAAAMPMNGPSDNGSEPTHNGSATTVPTPADNGSAAAVPDMRASVAEALAKEREAKPARTWPAYPTPAKPLPRTLPGPPTWPVNPQVLERPAVAATATDGDDGIDWGTIGIGVGLTFVALGAIAAVSRSLRQKPRPRVVG